MPRVAEIVPETWSDLAALGVQLHPFGAPHDGPALSGLTTQLRRRHATGSAYIHLAQQLGTKVWTVDGPLACNAADHGLPAELVT